MRDCATQMWSHSTLHSPVQALTPPSLSCLTALSGSSSSHCVSQSQPTHTTAYHQAPHNTTLHRTITTPLPHHTTKQHLIPYTITTAPSVFKQIGCKIVFLIWIMKVKLIVLNNQILKILFNIIFCEIFLFYWEVTREDSEDCFYLVLNVNILTVRVLSSLKRIELIKIWIHSIHSLQL